MKYEIVHTDDVEEALCLIFSGLMFFLTHHTKKTIIAVLLFCGSTVYVAMDYAISDKIKIEELKPLSNTFYLIPETYAQGQNAIMIDGVYYGENDPNYLIYKIKNSNEIIIYNKYFKTGFKYTIPALEEFKYKRNK